MKNGKMELKQTNPDVDTKCFCCVELGLVCGRPFLKNRQSWVVRITYVTERSTRHVAVKVKIKGTVECLTSAHASLIFECTDDVYFCNYGVRVGDPPRNTAECHSIIFQPLNVHGS